MKNLNLLIVIALLMLFGCSPDTLTGIQEEAELEGPAAVMTAQKTVKMVPIKGTLAGSGRVDPTLTDCPEGTVPIQGEGSGVASHLGQFEVSLSHCSYFFFDPFNPTYVNGRSTVIAANGDEIYATYNGFLTGPDTYINFITVVGGTGRFENGTGSYDEYGTFVQTPEGFNYESSFEGFISSVGSNK